MKFDNLAKDDEHCRLASTELVDEYNGLVGIFRRIDESLAQVANTDDFSRLTQRLGRVRGLVERNHYRVGFIGPSQIGKSTTFNNVLGINKALLGSEEYARQAPASEGSGSATTASITRLRVAAANSCTVHYLSREDHDERLKFLLTSLFASSDQLNNEHLAEVIAALETESAPAQQDIPENDENEDEEPDVSDKNDRQMVLKYLKSYQEHKEYLGQVKADVPWGDRKKYINHEEGQPVSPKWLQRHVDIGFASEMISTELEMIDLPGLDASAWDDQLTNEFLPDLDAALVFNIVAQNVDNRLFKKTMARLNSHFTNRLNGRVWGIVFHIEALSETKIHGDENERTLFDNLAAAIGSKGIPLEQVLIISNNWFSQYIVPDSNPPKAVIPHDTFTGFPWQFRVDESNQLQPPEGWGRHPELWRAFLPVTKDGGIDALRELMKVTIANEVKKNVHSDARQKLQKLRQDLQNLVEWCREKAGMSLDKLLAARQSATLMTQVDDKLRWDPDYFLNPSLELITKLHETFDRLCPEDYPLAPEKLYQEHHHNIGPIADLAASETKGELLPSLYEAANSFLEKELPAEAREIKVPVRLDASSGTVEKISILDAWSQFQRFDTSRGLIQDDAIEKLRKSQLFSKNNDYRTFNSVEEYRNHMRSRLSILVQQICHKATLRMRLRLSELKDGLRFLGSDDRDGGNGDDKGKPATASSSQVDFAEFDAVIAAIEANA